MASLTSYRTDGPNIVNSTQDYALRPTKQADTLEEFDAVLKTDTVFKRLYIQHTIKNLVETYHVKITFEPKDQRVLDLVNNRPESTKVRADKSGRSLHIQPASGEVTEERDQGFFERGEYQTKYIEGMYALIDIAKNEGMTTNEEVDRLLGILVTADIVIPAHLLG